MAEVMRSCTAKLEIRAALAQADRIAKLHDAGVSGVVLAQRFDVSTVVIYRALKQAREKSAQPCSRSDL